MTTMVEYAHSHNGTMHYKDEMFNSPTKRNDGKIKSGLGDFAFNFELGQGVAPRNGMGKKGSQIAWSAGQN